jgi:hypothetical protein
MEEDEELVELLDGLNCKSKGEDNGKRRSWGMLISSQHFGGRGVCCSSGMRLGRAISGSIIHADLHKPNNKLVSVKLEHFWCMNEPRANMDSQDSPRPGLGESHHLPLLVYFVLGHETSTQMSFCLGTPKWESQNSQNRDFCDFGGP